MRSLIGQDASNSSNWRAFIEKRCVAPVTLNDDDDDDTPFGRSFSYHKLPQQLLKLSVLKLDGSFFDVHVGRNATVAELKQAVEEVFSTSPKEGQGKISWSHVWGYFCLSFDGQKLLIDKACIRNFGIKDGDQLQFIRHLSVNYPPVERHSEDESVACKQHSKLSSESNAPEKKARTGECDNQYEDDKFKYYQYENEGVPVPEFKLADFLRGWLSYSRLWGVSRKGLEGRCRPSRFSLYCLGGGARIIQL